MPICVVNHSFFPNAEETAVLSSLERGPPLPQQLVCLAPHELGLLSCSHSCCGNHDLRQCAKLPLKHKIGHGALLAERGHL